jgi:hypothetical protein
LFVYNHPLINILGSSIGNHATAAAVVVVAVGASSRSDNGSRRNDRRNRSDSRGRRNDSRAEGQLLRNNTVTTE